MGGQFELRGSEATYNGHFEAKKSDTWPKNAYMWKKPKYIKVLTWLGPDLTNPRIS